MQESYTLEKFNSGRTVVGDAITELAKTDDRIWLLTPDIGWGVQILRQLIRADLSIRELQSSV